MLCCCRRHRCQPPRALGLLLLLPLGSSSKPQEDWILPGSPGPRPLPPRPGAFTWTTLTRPGASEALKKSRPKRCDAPSPGMYPGADPASKGLETVHVPPLAAAPAGPGFCDTMYQGFAECLIRMGDGMGRGGELETVCRSWNDFHACTSRVLSRCPKEAAAMWESLQQEARRAPHADNLHALCRASVRVRERGAGPETNQETLRSTAPASAPALTPQLLAAALALACILGPRA